MLTLTHSDEWYLYGRNSRAEKRTWENEKIRYLRHQELISVSTACQIASQPFLCPYWYSLDGIMALLYSQSWNFSWGAKLPLSLGFEVQLSSEPMIRHSNLIWGTKASIAVSHQLFKMNRSKLHFESQFCDVIQENSWSVYSTFLPPCK